MKEHRWFAIFTLICIIISSPVLLVLVLILPSELSLIDKIIFSALSIGSFFSALGILRWKKWGIGLMIIAAIAADFFAAKTGFQITQVLLGNISGIILWLILLRGKWSNFE